MDFLKYFPYPEPREIQKQALRTLGENWDKYDVFVLQAPTAFGKTAVSKAIMGALRSVSVITPTNLLVEQFKGEFPDTSSLHRLDSYYCGEWKRPCSVTRGKLKQFCKGCACSSDLSTAKYRKGPGVYNYYTYLAHKLYRDVLVVDEAHNLIPTIKDRMALTIWQHDVRYPTSAWNHQQLLQWAESQPESKRKGKKLGLLLEALKYPENPQYVVQRTRDDFNGKGTLRGQPEARDCIKLIPTDITQAPPIFWPRDVRKIVLLSATIGVKDIEQLGLKGKRVCYINCKSPIPAENRPIHALDITPVNRSNMEQVIPQLARHIQAIADHHGGEKGVIHATYQMSTMLSAHLTEDRYIFHSAVNKREQYERFRASKASEGKILVACGMYEGIDLPEDLGRWQVIAKVPWMSLGNPAIKHLAERDEDWYLWETIKTTVQACGRICRTPTDFGRTYILDQTFQRMMRDGNHMIPQWFTDAIESA